MRSGRTYGWIIVVVTAIVMMVLAEDGFDSPPLATWLFWIALLAAAELLPVSLGFGSEVTMAFPVHLALALTFSPPTAMAIAGLSAVDQREFRGELPLWRALFNRAQLMLAVGASSAIAQFAGEELFTFPTGFAVIVLAALVHVATNLALVAGVINQDRGVPFSDAIRRLLPNPVSGFIVAQLLLAGLGAATAAVYDVVGSLVAVFLIPLLFARLSILGARAQQELSEKVKTQQQALLEATERVFQEREDERTRIAEHIHDSSLQMLAAATYGCSNASELLDAGRQQDARRTLTKVREAVDGAIHELRQSLVDLRRSSVEEGGLMETIQTYVGQVSTLWGKEIRIEGGIANEPPTPVSLAAVQILQEGLINALKHAQSSTVTVKVQDVDGFVHIVVEDDGTGFDPAAEVGVGHHGTRMMRERAERVGGRIELESEPGRGTRLEAVLPGGVGR